MSTATEARTCEWPQRLKRHRTKDWRKPAGSLCVNRPSLWGNPYPVVDGDNAAAVLKYRFWLASRPDRVAQAREQLAGKTLLCHCDPDQDCHADVLIEVANTPEDAYGAPIPVEDVETEVLALALQLGAKLDDAEKAIRLITEWPEEYLGHDLVRNLIGVVTAPALPVARVDWDALARALMVSDFAVPDHVAAVWAFAAHLAIETPIAIERALSDMDAFTAMRAQELFWEGPK